jgi:hypothetical protein
MSALRFLLQPTALAIIGFVVSICVAASVQIHRDNERFSCDDECLRTGVMGAQSFDANLVVESYDAEKKILTAAVHSRTAGQDLRMRLSLTPATPLQRRDAIVENGVIVGMERAEKASPEELLPGIRGVVTMSYREGATVPTIHRIVIGDPFPRP